MALQPIEAPSWTQNERWVRIPVDIYADDEYRAFYGDSWVTGVVNVSIGPMLSFVPQGMLDIEATHTWNPIPMDVHCLNSLTKCKSTATNPERVRIRFAANPTRATISPGCGGRGCVSSGRDLIIADRALAPGHNGGDIAEEGIAIAHEVLHTLGVPHQNRAR